MYLKFSAQAYFRTRNSNLKSVSNKNQLEISRNLIRDNRIYDRFGNTVRRPSFLLHSVTLHRRGFKK